MTWKQTPTNKRPLVSVVLPAYNAEATIEAAIASVLNQSYDRIELIVCDDASVDNTYQVIEAINDSRIRLIHNDTNQGQGLSTERSIDAVTGDWIALIDADDMWHPYRLKALVDAANGDTDIIVFDDFRVYLQTQTGLKPSLRIRGLRAFGARHGQPVDVSGAAWTASPLFLFQPLIPVSALRASGVRHSTRSYGEDTEFIFNLVSKGFSLRYVPEAYYFYRVAPHSMSAIPDRTHKLLFMLEDIFPKFSGNPAIQTALIMQIEYQKFTIAIKSGYWCSAVKMAFRRPRLIVQLTRLLYRDGKLELDRIIKGGQKRQGVR